MAKKDKAKKDGRIICTPEAETGSEGRGFPIEAPICILIGPVLNDSDHTARFVLLAHPRSGSQLLRTGLEQHPRVLALNELYHPQEPVRRDHHPLDDGTWLRDGEDGAEFVARALALRPGRDAVGFKLSYRDARRGSFASVWTALAADPELRVVHLYRAQHLETLASLTLARASNQWLVYREDAQGLSEPPAIELAPELVQSYVDCMERDQRTALEALGQARRIDLEYGQLVERYQATLDAVFEFLGVSPRPVVERLVKQETRPIHERIANYDALAERFAGTPYARYFERRSAAG
jgi:hypothetical protein